MKISISYRYIESPEAVEPLVNRRIAKIGKLLKSYQPDLVQLHGNFDPQARRPEYSFSLNLSLPTGTLHATGTSSDPRSAAQRAFVELESQIKKHQARLRKDYEWKRKRLRPEQVLA